MKKLIFLLVVVFAFGVLSAEASVDRNIIEFEPVGGGKFIYSNNPEELAREDLADDGEAPAYIMNNPKLTADKYRLYMTHFNRVTKVSDTGEKYPGENIWLDAVFTAKEDCEIVFSRTAFEIPENVTTYLNYETIKTERSWSALQATADLLGEPIHMLNSELIFTPRTQNEHRVTLKKGERLFLSSIIDNYAAVPYPKHVFMAADFEIKSGTVDADVFAAKTRVVTAEGEVSYPNVDFETCGFGIYKPGRTQKGIADSMPELQASIEYEITDETRDGSYIPVTVKNQYYPEGNFVTEWVTNLNAQDDIYSKNLVDESNILRLFYEDESKLGYYGENVSENERDSVWIFDATHSDTLEWTEEMGTKKADYSPNYLLSADESNIGYACSVGNYGVTLRYNLKITNNAAAAKYLEYTASTAADIVVEVRDKNGELLAPVASKGQTSQITKAVMASVELPAGETSEFSVSMLLPVQNYGGQRQSFTICDKKSENVIEKNTQIQPILAAEKPKLDVEALLASANEETKFILSGNTDDLKIVETAWGYAAYYSVIEGNPYKYGYYWPITERVFILDNDFNIIKELCLESQPIEMSYAGGKLYVKTIANGSFAIDEALELEPFDSYILPRENENAAVWADKGRPAVLVGEKYLNVKFEKNAPLYTELADDIFYFATNTSAAASDDGVYWNYYSAGEEIRTAEASEDGLLVNGTLLKPFGKDRARVILNGEVLGFAIPCEKSGAADMMPMRFFFEEIGMRVLFNPYSGRILAFGAGGVFEFTPGSDKAAINGEEVIMDVPAEIINGSTFIPVSVLARLSGFEYTSDEENNTAEVTGKIGKLPGDIELGGNISVVAKRNIKADGEK